MTQPANTTPNFADIEVDIDTNVSHNGEPFAAEPNGEETRHHHEETSHAPPMGGALSGGGEAGHQPVATQAAHRGRAAQHEARGKNEETRRPNRG